MTNKDLAAAARGVCLDREKPFRVILLRGGERVVTLVLPSNMQEYLQTKLSPSLSAAGAECCVQKCCSVALRCCSAVQCCLLLPLLQQQPEQPQEEQRSPRLNRDRKPSVF